MFNIELALRELQKLDEVAGRGIVHEGTDSRKHLIRALDALGEELGLECTGVQDGTEHYSHDGDTCPIHEWFNDADYYEVTPENDR